MTVNRFSQSKKWREGLTAELRVPMVNVGGEHFYVYEPAQLLDMSMVVPVFFYRHGSDLRARCLRATQAGPLSQSLLIPPEPDFHSSDLLDINVNCLAASFPRIQWADGQLWSSCPNSQLLRTCLCCSSNTAICKLMTAVWACVTDRGQRRRGAGH